MPPELPSRLRRLAVPAAVVVSSLIWAAVMIDTGEIAWPLGVWMATTLAPLSIWRKRRAEEASE